MLRKIHPAGRNVSVNVSVFTLTFLPAKWILSVTYLFEDTYFPIGGLQPSI